MDVVKKKVSPRRRKASEESTTYQSQETPEPTPAYPIRRYICSSLVFKLMIVASFVFILGVLLVSLTSPLSEIEDRLQAGSPIEVPTKPIRELLLPRDDAFLSLKEVLSQRVRASGYYTLVMGPHGCGKTTLMLQVLSEIRKERGGVIYVPLAGQNFHSDFYKAVKFAFDSYWHTFFENSRAYSRMSPFTDADDAFSFLIDYVGQASLGYAKKHDVRFTLVFDDVSHLLKDSPETLARLQRISRDLVVRFPLHIVFIASGGNVRNEFYRGSGMLGMKVHDVEDVSQEDALKILSLNASSNINITDIYVKVTGGRLKLLWDVQEHLSKASLSSLTRHFIDFTRKCLQKCLSMPDGKSITQKVFHILNEHGGKVDGAVVTDSIEYVLSPKARDVYCCLIDEDIIFESGSSILSYYSAIVETAARALMKPVN